MFPPISTRQPQFTTLTPENSRDFLFARPVLNSYSPATRRILSFDARRFYGAVCRRVVLVLACDPHLGTDVNSVASGMSRSAWRVRNGNKKPLWLRRAAFRWFCVPPNIPGRAFACSRELRKSSSHVTANEVNLYALALNASGNFANHKIDTLECGNFVRLSGQTVSG